MFLTLTLALLPQFTAGPQQLAPYGLPHTSPVSPQSQSFGGPAVVEDFEAYLIAAGSAENTGSSVIFDGTITGTGQGPGLVLPGCSYYCDASGQIQWNGDAYFGLSTKKILANSSDQRLGIRYYDLQASVSLNLHSFDGYPETATVNAFNSSGALVDSTGPVSVPDASPVPVTLTGPGISRVEINGSAYPWSPIIDNHDYSTSASCGLQLSIVGPCPGVNTITINGGTPGAPCKIGYAFGLGSYAIPAGPCAGTLLGLDATATALPGTWFFDGGGQIVFTQFIPAGACGNVFVQALEIGACCTSNVVAL
jgi:hypothetical protein